MGACYYKHLICQEEQEALKQFDMLSFEICSATHENFTYIFKRLVTQYFLVNAILKKSV